MKNIIKFLLPSIVALTLGISGVVYAGLTSPVGGSGLVTPATFCQVASGVWQFCNTADVLGDNSNPIAGGEFTALTIGTATISGVVAGDLTIAGGEVVLGSTTQDGTLVIHDDDGGGDATVTIQAADATGTNYTLTLPGNDGDADEFLQTDGNGVLSWAAAGAFSPSVTLSTLFETEARFQTQATNGTATYGTDGVSLSTTATGGSYIRHSINTGRAQFVTELSPEYSAQILLSTIGTDVQAFFGLDFITASGSGITYTSKHIGFKVVRTSSGDTELFATQGDGTTETASSVLTILSLNDDFSIALKKNGTDSVDYYWRVGNGAWSSATNLTTNIPTGNNIQITHVVSNVNVATNSAFRIEFASYKR